VATPLVNPQIGLIAGSPTPAHTGGYATDVLMATAEGVKRAAEANGPSVGSRWIVTSEEWRRAVVLQMGGDVSVIDFDTASIAKHCARPRRVPGTVLHQWLIDSPVHG